MNLFPLGIIGSISMAIIFMLFGIKYFLKKKNYFKFGLSLFVVFLSLLLIVSLTMINNGIGKEGNIFYLMIFILGVLITFECIRLIKFKNKINKKGGD